MSLPEIELHRVNKMFTKICEQRIPPDVRDQIRLLYKITGNKVILIESRPYYDDPTQWSEMPIAQFAYTISTKVRSLFGYNRNDQRLPYSKGSLDKLIQEVCSP